MLDTLLLLNHEGYAEEVAQGLHDAEEVAQGLHDKGNKKGKSGGKKKRKTQVSPGQTSLWMKDMPDTPLNHIYYFNKNLTGRNIW